MNRRNRELAPLERFHPQTVTKPNRATLPFRENLKEGKPKKGGGFDAKGSIEPCLWF